MLDGVKSIFKAILAYSEVNIYVYNLVHGRKLYYKKEKNMLDSIAVYAVSNVVEIIDEEEQIFFDKKEINKILPSASNENGHTLYFNARYDMALWLKFISNLSNLSTVSNFLQETPPQTLKSPPSEQETTPEDFVDQLRKKGITNLKEIAQHVDEKFTGSKQLSDFKLGELLPANPQYKAGYAGKRSQGQRLRGKRKN